MTSMTTQPITITVSGPIRSGKTTIAAIIGSALSAYGVTVIPNDPEGDLRAAVVSVRTGARKVHSVLKDRPVQLREVHGTRKRRTERVSKRG